MKIDTRTVRDIVQASLHAPSGDNIQPFRFEWDGERLRILSKEDRLGAFLDVLNAASWISLGALLATVEIAAAKHGFSVTNLTPPAKDATLPGAELTFQTGPGHAQDSDLFAYLAARCSNRRSYESTPPEPSLLNDLTRIAAESMCQLDWVSARPELQTVADASAPFDTLLFENDTMRDEIFKMVRWSRNEAARTRDGFTLKALEGSFFDYLSLRPMSLLRILPRLSAAIGTSALHAARARQLYRRSGAIGLLSTAGDAPEDWMSAGKGFQRVWLSLTARGWALQPMSGFIFLMFRSRRIPGTLTKKESACVDRFIRDTASVFPAITSRIPTMMFRIGKAPAPSDRTLRYTVDQVLTILPSQPLS